MFKKRSCVNKSSISGEKQQFDDETNKNGYN